MLNSSILDTLIGLMLMYAALALVATGVTEMIGTFLRIRPKVLEFALQQVLGSNYFKQFYNNPRIATLTRKLEDESDGMKLPAYLAPSTFASTFVDVLLSKVADNDPAAARSQVKQDFGKLRDMVNAVEEPNLRYLLQTAVAKVEGQAADGAAALAAFEKELENYYNQLMERVSGWFKRKAHLITVAVGIVVCALSNADTIMMARTLSNSPEVRKALVTQAATYQDVDPSLAGVNCPTLLQKNKETPTAMSNDELQGLLKCQSALTSARMSQATTAFPIGWDNSGLPQGGLAWAMKVLGILISGLAVSLGAAFWFQAMQNLMRLTGKLPPAAAPAVVATGTGVQGPESGPAKA
ncbi:MAG: hypothetical protein RIR00_1078 [Pseudomonadota bacterium]|jgi:hypothetical protein